MFVLFLSHSFLFFIVQSTIFDFELKCVQQYDEQKIYSSHGCIFFFGLEKKCIFSARLNECVVVVTRIAVCADIQETNTRNSRLFIYLILFQSFFKDFKFFFVDLCDCFGLFVHLFSFLFNSHNRCELSIQNDNRD